VAFAGVEGAAAQATSGRILIGHSQKCVDLPDGNLNDNVTINQFQCDGSPQQVFTVVVAANNYYNIISGRSGKCLNVWNGAMADNTPVTQSQCDLSPQQGFSLVAVGGDYYYIVASHSGKCLNVPNSTLDDNVGLTQSQCNRSQAQMFWFQDLVGMNVAQRPQTQQQPQQPQQPQQTAQEQQLQEKIKQQQLQLQHLQSVIDSKDRQKIELQKKNDKFDYDAYYARVRKKHEQNKPLPPVVALHIEYVVAKRVSTGTDMATSVLFSTLDMAVSKIGSKAGGLAGSLTVASLRGVGVSFDDLLGTDIIAGNDDLIIALDGISQYPPAWNSTNSTSISSGQTLPIQMSWNVATNRDHLIGLVERDSASANDSLGNVLLPAGTLRPGFDNEFVVPNSSEGSLYTVRVRVTERLPGEPNGYVPASMWHNRKALCFHVFGCR